MAALILAIFLFVVPENFNTKSSEYLYLDMPVEASDVYLGAILDETIDGKAEKVTIKMDKKEKDALLYTLDNKEIYILNSKEDLIYMADKERKIAAVINMDDDYNFNYEYYIQGYETDKYEDLLKILHVESTETLEIAMDNQDVRPLYTNYELIEFGRTVPPLKKTLVNTSILFISILGGMLIALNIVEEKVDNTLSAINLTPTSRITFLLGKSVMGIILSIGLIKGMMQYYPKVEVGDRY